MKRTDKEIISAMEYLKSQHNGELPYKFGTFECAKMMAKYLIEQSSITAVVQAKPEVCQNVIHHTCKWFDQYNGCMGCLVKKYEGKLSS